MAQTNLLDGKITVVTGGAQGIGLAIATRFLENGATVVLADINEELARESAAAMGSDAYAMRIDVTDPVSVTAAADAIVHAHGRIDCVVANAGILVLEPVLTMSFDQWSRVINVNLTGSFLTVQGFARPMVAQGRGGRIIMNSSLFGIRGGVENGAYSASKFGVIGLMQSLAAELATHRITVNAVCPGQIDTQMIQQLFHDRSALLGITEDEVREHLLSRVPAGRLGSPSEIADAFVFLASDLSGYVTGQSLIVDGGFQVG